MGDLTGEKLLLFVLAALPGALAIRVYSLWCPTPQKDWKESLTDAVIYSVVGLALWVMFYPSAIEGFVETAFLTDTVEGSKKGVAFALLQNCYLLLLYAVVTPAALSCIWYFLRYRVFPRLLGFDHPTRTAWDWVFCRKKPFYLLMHLKSKNAHNQQMVKAGYFNGKSYVAGYPYDPEIYFERVHMVMPDGTIGEAIPCSDGMLIRASEVELFEFLIDPMAPDFVPWYKRCAVWFSKLPRKAWKRITK